MPSQQLLRRPLLRSPGLSHDGAHQRQTRGAGLHLLLGTFVAVDLDRDLGYHARRPVLQRYSIRYVINIPGTGAVKYCHWHQTHDVYYPALTCHTLHVTHVVIPRQNSVLKLTSEGGMLRVSCRRSPFLPSVARGVLCCLGTVLLSWHSCCLGTLHFLPLLYLLCVLGFDSFMH